MAWNETKVQLAAHAGPAIFRRRRAATGSCWLWIFSH